MMPTEIQRRTQKRRLRDGEAVVERTSMIRIARLRGSIVSLSNVYGFSTVSGGCEAGPRIQCAHQLTARRQAVTARGKQRDSTP